MDEEENWFWRNRWGLLAITTAVVFVITLFISARIYDSPPLSVSPSVSPSPSASVVDPANILPEFVGSPIDDVLNQLKEYPNITVETLYRDSNSYARDIVISQSIPAGTSLSERNVLLVLEVSSGEANMNAGNETIVVPSVVDSLKNEAKRRLENLGFQNIVFVELSSESPKNVVLAQSPPAEALAGPSTQITLFISSEKVVTPNVVGLTVNIAERVLNEAGLKISITNPTLNTTTALVLEQSVPSGKIVKPGTTVSLTLQEASPTETPPVETPTPTEPETPPVETPTPTEPETPPAETLTPTEPEESTPVSPTPTPTPIPEP